MTTRTVVVTQNEPFYLPHFFESFFPRLEADVDVRWLTVLDLFDESFPAFVRRMYSLYGPANFVRRGVDYGVRAVNEALGVRSYSVASVAEDHGVPVEVREDVNDPSFVAAIRELDVDVVLSVASPQIFDEELLDAPNWGCVNVHTSDLPKYRGMLPTFWALYHDEDEIGVTVHTMAPEIDHGEVVAQETFPVTADMTLDRAIRLGKVNGGALAAAALNDIAAGRESLRPMEGGGSYFSFPTTADRREFQRRGWELL